MQYLKGNHIHQLHLKFIGILQYFKIFLKMKFRYRRRCSRELKVTEEKFYYSDFN